MSSFIIEGGEKLKGEVKISGSKNASLPIIAASILNSGKTKLYNIPDIHDIYNDIYYDFKRENIKDEEILDKNISLRGIMKPLTLEENISNLKEVGFSKIDVFMKYNNFVGIITIK